MSAVDPLKETLRGRTIVITRALKQADAFAEELEKCGARVIICPTIEIAAPESFDRLDEAINDLYGYDWLIFTSVNGVYYFLRRMELLKRNIAELDEIRVCAIGDATANALAEAKVHVDLVPAIFKAEGIFSALEEFAGGSEHLRGLNFLIPRAATARDYLPMALTEAGARADVVPAYRTVLPVDFDRGRVSAMLAGGADCIAFTSSSTVRNLGQLFDTPDLSQVLGGVVVACIGPITEQTAIEYGLQPEIQPDEFTVPALVRAIVEYFSKDGA